MTKDAEHLVEELEKLESSVRIVEISAENGKLQLLEHYVEEHNKIKRGEQGDKDAVGNFNEYLQKKLQQDDPSYANSVVIAEITGQIGINKKYDYQFDMSNIEIDGADLSGCRLVNLYVFESFKDVILRDCFFENVEFNACDLSGVDLRGVKLKNCHFIGYGKETNKLNDLHMDFHSPEDIQKLGIFELDDNIHRMRPANEDGAHKEVEKDRKAELATFVADKKKEQGYKSWGLSFAYTTEAQQKFNSEMELGKKEIEDKYKQILQEKLKNIATKYKIKLSKERRGTKSDQTYIPRDNKRANAKKILMQVDVNDLIDYKAAYNAENPISFNEYILGIREYKEQWEEFQKQYPGEDLIIVADLSGQEIDNIDLSGLDLSEVNFAYAKFSGCKFDNADLTASCFEGAEFSQGTSFKKSTLTDANFIGVTGAALDFTNAMMPRIRMMYSSLKRVIFEGALLYSADLTGADMEHGILRNADASKGDLDGVNLRYADAQYVKMRHAYLKNAILEEADFSHADLTGAILEGVQAQKVIFEKAILDDAKLKFADLREAKLKEMQAKGVDLSESDLREAQAELANLENAIMDRANAQLANFEKAIFRDARAQMADFSHAVMEGIQGERFDVQKAILNETDLRNADLTGAVLDEVKAYKADFTKAKLEGARAEFAEMIACDFSEANARNMDLKGAKLPMCHFEEADCTGMEFNEETLLLDVNFRNAIGAEALKELQEKQHKLNPQLFGRSQYGACKNNQDGTNDRFKCQRIGADILAAAIGGGTGYVYGGPLAGMGGAIIAGIVTDRSLESIKNAYFKDQGYISNQLGDKLAELGALAIATGAGSLDKGANAVPVAAALCAVTGLISPESIGMVAGGGFAAFAGGKLLADGFTEQSMWKKAVGVVLTGLGSVSAYMRVASISTGLNAFAGIVLCGAAYGGIQGGGFAYNQLHAYNEEKGTGMRPEQIHAVSVQQAKDALQKIWPTWNKFLCAAVFCAIGVGIGFALAGPVASVVGMGLIPKALLGIKLGLGLGVFGGASGYIFDKKLSFWNHAAELKEYLFPNHDSLASDKQEDESKNLTKENEKEKEKTTDKVKENTKEVTKEVKKETDKDIEAKPVNQSHQDFVLQSRKDTEEVKKEEEKGGSFSEKVEREKAEKPKENALTHSDTKEAIIQQGDAKKDQTKAKVVQEEKAKPNVITKG
ncbi:MAG: hypothetical protein ACI8ZF_000799 [Candidatus Midichloriaceae bacterium]|jgi:uncharacterized protein YjbI with pentapeptide repeats